MSQSDMFSNGKGDRILIKDEKLTFDPIEDPRAKTLSDSEINEKYAKGEVRIVTEQARYPLPQIVDMVESENYQLNPEFQRRHRWEDDKRSRLIESFIMNVPIPPVFFYEYEYGHYEVMDGLQRLSAIAEFYRGNYRLAGLDQWPELNGKKYGELPSKVRAGIDRRYLSSVILLQETAQSEEEAARLKQLVFERINSGGVKLEPQESRNAIYNGPLNQLCMKLSYNPHLCLTWGIPEPTPREIAGGESPRVERLENQDYRTMQDVELVLRFFAYRQKHRLHKGTNLATYLDRYLQHGNRFPSKVLDKLKNTFEATIALARELFEERAFWLYRYREATKKWIWYSRPTTTIYDPMMLALSKLLDQQEGLIKRKPKLQQDLQQFYKDNYKHLEGRNVNPSVLQTRDKLFDEFFASFLK